MGLFLIRSSHQESDTTESSQRGDKSYEVPEPPQDLVSVFLNFLLSLDTNPVAFRKFGILISSVPELYAGISASRAVKTVAIG
jgi:hypothetical protein